MTRHSLALNSSLPGTTLIIFRTASSRFRSSAVAGFRLTAAPRPWLPDLVFLPAALAGRDYTLSGRAGGGLFP